jgi:hypothetical protein
VTWHADALGGHGLIGRRLLTRRRLHISIMMHVVVASYEYTRRQISIQAAATHVWHCLICLHHCLFSGGLGRGAPAQATRNPDETCNDASNKPLPPLSPLPSSISSLPSLCPLPSLGFHLPRMWKTCSRRPRNSCPPGTDSEKRCFSGG